MSKSLALCLPPAALALALLTAGCGSSSKGASTPVIPVTPTPSQLNNYAGTQNPSDVGIVSYGGVWSLTLNGQLNQFSTYDVTNIPSVNSGSPIAGVTASSGSFLGLTPENGGGQLNNGFAFSIPGEVALLRPGYNGEAPVVLAGQTSCLGVKAASKFLFVTLPNLTWTPAASPAYGSLQATSTGTAWSFGSVSESLLGGAAAPALTIPDGSCLQAQEGYVVSVAPQKATGNHAYTLAFGPTGYFVMDLGIGNQSTPGAPGVVGVLQASAAIATASVTSAKLHGFYYEPLAGDLGLPVTQPAFFGQSHTATAIVGGVYPNDDPTTTPNADTSIDFGAQDGSANGLYSHVKVTVPDPNAVCTGTAVTTTPSGAPGCLLQATAIVGDANNRFSVFLIAWDTTNSTPLGIYLFAQ